MPNKNKYLQLLFGGTSMLIALARYLQGDASLPVMDAQALLNSNISEENKVIRNDAYEKGLVKEQFKNKFEGIFANFKDSFTELQRTLINKNNYKKQGEEGYLEQMDEYYQKAVNKAATVVEKDYNEMVQMVENSDQNNYALSDIFSNLSAFFDSLTHEQLGAFIHLIGSYIIISATISIIFIFYGDFFIIKFKLEEKYSKLARFIKIRRKFQQYYLLISIAWIFFAIILEVIADLAVLFFI